MIDLEEDWSENKKVILAKSRLITARLLSLQEMAGVYQAHYLPSADWMIPD